MNTKTEPAIPEEIQSVIGAIEAQESVPLGIVKKEDADARIAALTNAIHDCRDHSHACHAEADAQARHENFKAAYELMNMAIQWDALANRIACARSGWRLKWECHPDYRPDAE
jgi:hypothetical protein